MIFVVISVHSITYSLQSELIRPRFGIVLNELNQGNFVIYPKGYIISLTALFQLLDFFDSAISYSRYQVIRVGGRGMSDRHKWLDMFEDVRAVVFCVALSDYDSLWVDSSGTASNKMIQTRDLFESILRHPCFQDTPFVLLLNKYDMFEDKIFRGVPLTNCTWFSDFRPVGTSHYTPQNQAQQAYQYIAHKYKELFTSINCTGRKLFTFQLNALDKITVSRAFQYVKEILKWEDQKASAWGMIPEDLSYSTDISSFSHPSGTRQPDDPKR